MAAITICSDFGAPKNKVWHCFHCFPIYFPWSDGTRCHDLSFWMLSFKPTFSLSSFTTCLLSNNIFCRDLWSIFISSLYSSDGQNYSNTFSNEQSFPEHEHVVNAWHRVFTRWRQAQELFHPLTAFIFSVHYLFTNWRQEYKFVIHIPLSKLRGWYYGGWKYLPQEFKPQSHGTFPDNEVWK